MATLSVRCINCSLLALLLSSSYLHAASWFDLQPFVDQHYGYLGVTGSYTDAEDISAQELGFTGELHSRAVSQGYIYRPWVVTMNVIGTLNANYNRFNIYEGESRSELNGGLGSNIVLFPVDEIPTNINLDFNQLRSYGTEDNIYNRFKTSIGNSIASETLRLINRYEFRHETETENGRVFNYHNLKFKYNGNFDDSLNFASLEYIIQDAITDDIDNSDNTLLAEYNHSFYYSEKNSSLFTLSYSQVDKKSEDTVNAVVNSRFSSNNSWYVNSLPELKLSFFAQAYRFEQDANIKDQVEPSKEMNLKQNQTSISSTLNLDYQLTDDIDLSASFFAETLNVQSYLDDEQYFEESGNRYQEQVKVRWRHNMPLGDFNYHAFVGNTLSAAQSDETESKWLLDFSHGLKRFFPVGNGSIGLSASQAYRQEIAFEGVAQQDQLTHYLDVNWSVTDGITQTSIYGRFTDERSPQNHEFKQDRFDIGLSGSLNSSSKESYGGDLYYSWYETHSEFSETTVSHSGSGRAWYRYKHLFDVWGLMFESSLTLPVADYFFDDGDKRKDIATLETKLEYKIGLLELVSENSFSNGTQYYSISAKRRF